jgi:hypothetical protein
MTDKPSNDFRREFNAFVENQREVRRAMFELFAMDAGAGETSGPAQIEYWGKRAAALGKPRSKVARIHQGMFRAPTAAFHGARAGKRPRKQAMHRQQRVIVLAKDLHK